MNHFIFALFISIIGLLSSCVDPGRLGKESESIINMADSFLYESETLTMQCIAPETYLYICYLETVSFGKVACNGLVYINNAEAVVFDAPSTNAVTLELIQVIEKELKANVVKVIVNHFHEDCIGGLKAFHDMNIPSFAHYSTISILRNKQKNADFIPQNSFRSLDTIQVGNQRVINSYLGKGHTSDNIVSYIPATKVLFGGCLIKAVNATKGNLEDADTMAWATTVSLVKAQYPDVSIVVPGHGLIGDTSLLEYTIRLFE